MAKVIDPIDPLKVSKRLGQNVILRQRKEGLTMSFHKPQKAPVFFAPSPDTIVKKEITARWENKTEEEKDAWEENGRKINLSGKTFFSMQEKKSMSTGFYNLGQYGGTKNNGVLLTIYSTIYKIATYGVNKYRRR